VPPCSVLKVNWMFKQDESNWFYIYDKISVYTSSWIQRICRIQTGNKLKITRIEEDLWWAHWTVATGRVSAWAISLSTKLWCFYILNAWTCMGTTFMYGVLIFYCTCDWNWSWRSFRENVYIILHLHFSVCPKTGEYETSHKYT